MAMKVVFFYQQGARGWTETWYTQANNPISWQEVNITPALLTTLVAFRAAGTRVVACRISQVDPPRLSFTLQFAGRYKIVSTLGSTTNAPDMASTDAMWQINGTDGSKRKLFIRGLRDVDTVRDADGFDTPSPFLTSGVNKMLTNLFNIGLVLRSQVRPPNGGLAWNTVIGVTPQVAMPAYTQITTLNNPVLPSPPPCKIVFQQLNKDNLPGFPIQTETVPGFVIAGNGIVVKYRYRGPSNPTPFTTMRFTGLVYTYIAMGTWTFVAFSERKTGRPFGVPRGRARSPVRAQ
jgi:hypothetical protein